jgi:hypothetical protein
MRQRRPAVIEGIGLVEDIVGREIVHFEQINLCLKLGQFGNKLV